MDEIKKAIDYLEPLTKHPSLTGSYCKYLKVAVKTLRKTLDSAKKNKPLTLEELRDMDGEPVYLQFGDGGQGWAIAETSGCNSWFTFYGIDFENENPDIDFLNMEYKDPAGHYGLHVLGWRAYRSKPVREE